MNYLFIINITSWTHALGLGEPGRIPELRQPSTQDELSVRPVSIHLAYFTTMVNLVIKSRDELVWSETLWNHSVLAYGIADVCAEQRFTFSYPLCFLSFYMCVRFENIQRLKRYIDIASAITWISKVRINNESQLELWALASCKSN